jgi:hypothetical protein
MCSAWPAGHRKRRVAPPVCFRRSRSSSRGCAQRGHRISPRRTARLDHPPSRAAAARRARRGRRLSARRVAARGAARALARRRAISTWAAWIRVASAPRDLCTGRRPRPDDEENRTCRKPITVSLQQTGIRPSGGNLDLVATVRTCSTPRPWHARCWVAGSWETPAPQPRLSSESSVVAEAHWRNRECGHNRWLP